MRVPFLDLALQYKTMEASIQPVIKSIMEKGIFIGGQEVANFEREFSRQLGIDHCIGVGNGTDALFLSLKALGVGIGDQVITAANSFIASAEAITMVGATPVFVDCDPATYLMNVDLVERILTKSQATSSPIKAIIPVHLYGRALDMDSLMSLATRYRVFVVEDCAQAHFAEWKGRPVGTFGDAGCFSFYPGKNLGAYGDAGAIVTREKGLAEILRKLHDHGRAEKYAHEFPGINSRLDSIQAAVLNLKLPKVREWNKLRRRHAAQYAEALKSVPGLALPDCPKDEGHVFHLFVIRTKVREALRRALQDKGISTGVHYPIALPNTQAYQNSGSLSEEVPVANAYQDEILSLPMFPELTFEQISYVTDTIKQFLKAGIS